MIHLILALALVGFLTWAVVAYVAMPDPVKKPIIVIVVIAIVVYAVSLLGFDIPVPSLRR